MSWGRILSVGAVGVRRIIRHILGGVLVGGGCQRAGAPPLGSVGPSQTLTCIRSRLGAQRAVDDANSVMTVCAASRDMQQPPAT